VNRAPARLTQRRRQRQGLKCCYPVAAATAPGQGCRFKVNQPRIADVVVQAS
jgi:hypothetical protein